MKAYQLLLAALLTGAVIVVAANVVQTAPSSSAERDVTSLPAQRELASLEQANGWLNSAPLSATDLRGKVVLVEFWTYSCINWIRTLPYVRAWADKYKDKGLVVIGVHTPEFEFEKDVGNIRRATHDLAVGFPVAIDSDYAIWRSFKNNHWPALYFIDAQGRMRHHQFGEGDYEQSEEIIRKLLAESGQVDLPKGLVSVKTGGLEVAADWNNLKSPETYVGYGRAQRLDSRGGVRQDRDHLYSAMPSLALNQWALDGNWTVKKQSAVMNKPNGRILYRFHARDVHLVLGPTKLGSAIRFRVLIDGQPPGPAHGSDVDEQGNGTLNAQRLYQLIRQSSPITDRTFEIQFLDPGAEAFAFTFG